YAESIIEAIGRSTLTVLVFSAHANSSPHVRRELERTASHGIPILPFRVEDVVPAPSVEYFISDAHWLDAMTPPMEQHLDHLVGTVRLLLDRQAARTGSSVPLGGATVTSGDTGSVPTSTGSSPAGKRVLYAVLVAVVLVTVVIALVVALDRPGSSETAAPASQSTEQQTTGGEDAEVAAPVIVEFDDGVGEGWTWENEDPQAWTVEDGALRIAVKESPPPVNVLLRDLPEGDAVIQTRIDFDPVAPAHAAGLALVGDDLGSRVELSFEIASGFYSAAFQSDTTPDWQIHTAPLPDFVTRVGLITYATEEAGGETAVFTRFVLQ
ncbi:MAG: hypothetical protein ABR500_06150, partial [Dermatophilaceae bacterium]